MGLQTQQKRRWVCGKAGGCSLFIESANLMGIENGEK
jgi:hypothetical protein